MNYWEVQKIAKDTIDFARENIFSGMNLMDIRRLCEDKMLELGADSFWYWDVGAFVFAGDETTVSVSGAQYETSSRCIAENDIITIDLSPQCGNIWGDYARTLIVENGNVVQNQDVQNAQWRKGLSAELLLHEKMRQYVTPQTTFDELYGYMNSEIKSMGYTNLDFMGNLGHSIVKEKNDRIYIEKGNHHCLGDVSFFTFEPHICIEGSKYGFKWENIYYFKDSRLAEL